MSIRRKTASILVLLFVFFSCYAESTREYKVKGVTDKIYYSLSGVWVHELHTDTSLKIIMKSLSWGESKIMDRLSMVIDLEAEVPYITEPGAELPLNGLYEVKDGGDEIIEIREIEENLYRIFVYNHSDDEKHIFDVKVNEDGSINFKGQDYRFGTLGGPYIKIDGPERQ
jgi:hypothetical protein